MGWRRNTRLTAPHSRWKLNHHGEEADGQMQELFHRKSQELGAGITGPNPRTPWCSRLPLMVRIVLLRQDVPGRTSKQKPGKTGGHMVVDGNKPRSCMERQTLESGAKPKVTHKIIGTGFWSQEASQDDILAILQHALLKEKAHAIPGHVHENVHTAAAGPHTHTILLTTRACKENWGREVACMCSFGCTRG